jgi:hypothetical protein
MRTFARFCFSALAFISATARADDGTQVYFDHHELNYIGDLHKEANQKLFALYDSLPEKPTTLLIRSGGGEIFTGMELAAWIRDRSLDVKVLEYCLSSCANYVFPAGKHKTVSNFALIGFHGGASSTVFQFDAKTQAMVDAMTPQKRDEFMADLKKEEAQNGAREAVFFKSIGVRQEMTTLGQQARYKSLMERVPETAMWTYSLEDFARLGVGAITVINPPWKPVSPNKAWTYATLPLD